MNFVRQMPTPELSNLVKYYWHLEINQTEVPSAHIAFPYGAFELICFIKNPNRMRWLDSCEEFYEPELFYAGQVTKPYVLNFEQPCICEGISMQPWAGNFLFNIPAVEFKNQLVQLSEISNDNSFADKLLTCRSATSLFTCFETFLLDKVRRDIPDPVIMHLGKNLCVRPNYETLENTLNHINLGRRRIEQRFKESVGLSMSMFIKKTRFQHSLQLLSDIDNDNRLNDISFELGYYDQSHFIHDFKQFAGVTPKQYIAQKSELKDFLLSLTHTPID